MYAELMEKLEILHYFLYIIGHLDFQNLPIPIAVISVKGYCAQLCGITMVDIINLGDI